ncbi:MAG: amidohydrolase [Verrucomicrobiales bacterium]|nr:amidohydrolase [Verrucomicrobiales bacterium]
MGTPVEFRYLKYALIKRTLRPLLMRTFRKMLIVAGSLLAICALAATELLAPGFRPVPPDVHALVGATVVVKPGQVISNATIVLRGGKIEKVGVNISIPPDARVWNLKSNTVYAGFIDAYLTLSSTGSPDAGGKKDRNELTAGVKFFGVPGGERDPGNPGPGSELPAITPERRMAKTFAPESKSLESLRELGFTTANVVPDKGILRGTSVFVALGETDPNRAIMRADVFQHVGFEEGVKEDAYPESLMGVVAAIRQNFFDAQHAALRSADGHVRSAAGVDGGSDYNPAIEALIPAVKKQITVAFEPRSALMVDRAARVAREIGLDFCIVSSGQEWRRPDLAKSAAVPFIVPVNFPEAPKLPTDDDWTQVSLDQLRAWDWAPENAALLRRQNLQIALTTFGLEDKKVFRKNLKLAIERGLTEADALAALTTVPAKLCGLDNQVGTIEAGKLANLTVVNGKGYFDPESKVQSVWIEGRFYRTDFEEPKSDSKADDKKDEETKPTTATPKVVEPEKSPAPEPTEAEKSEKSAKAKSEPEKSDKEKVSKDKKPEPPKPRVARSPLDGRGPLTNAGAILIEHATIWTCAKDGILTNASILIENGKISQVGNFSYDRDGDELVIDAKGEHVTPGLIDCHNHSMILGDVNEGTIPSTAMVRIGDVVNSETPNIYEQLAGGLTACSLLHGSANPIGGQNQVIKLRDGASPEDLKFAAAPQGIKFALGENVKQSNWGEKYKTRFPQTRMGVETFIGNRFIAAQRYLKQWDDYKGTSADGSPKSKSDAAKIPPRRDLELEAIVEILQGKRWIHSHSYRQDEILMLLRLMQSFGVQVGTFQHVLEGYKVAEELADGKVGGSTFADWWAYKFEVYDAIPYNGSLMRERGVVVSFNSDSSDLARHLNLEAAKAVKYGGTPEVEALKFVTLNPAKQLRIDKYVGSIEVGKDADLAIWNKNPLDSSSMCLQTWIDGKKYFDHDQSKQRFVAIDKERAALIEKAKKSAKGDSDKDGSGAAKKKFFEVSLEHRYDGKVRHCTEDEQ